MSNLFSSWILNCSAQSNLILNPFIKVRGLWIITFCYIRAGELSFSGNSLTDSGELEDHEGGDQVLYLICLLVGRRLCSVHWPWLPPELSFECWIAREQADAPSPKSGLTVGDNADNSKACMEDCFFPSHFLSSSHWRRKLVSTSLCPLARTKPIPLFGRGSTWTTWRRFFVASWQCSILYQISPQTEMLYSVSI